MKRTPLLVGLTLALVLGLAGPASATITPTSTSSDIATAIESLPALVTGSAFVSLPPLGTPNAVSDTALTGFPTDGTTYGIMTSGNPTLADDANASGSSGQDLDGVSVRGGAGSDRDVSVLRIDVLVPAGMNCLTLDFQFLSEEFPEFVGGSVNDGFIAELDVSDWTTNTNSTISAPNNFAFDTNGDVISINTSGATSMSSAEAAGTTYDGATPLLQARTPITPGTHSVYLSIFDQGDQVYDSAAFIDNLTAGLAAEGACEAGAQPLDLSISKEADEPTSEVGTQNGYTITITNPNDEPVDIDSVTDNLPEGFSYVEGSTTGDVTGDPEESEGNLTWEGSDGPLDTVPANGSISFHFDVIVASDPDTYTNVASAQVGVGSINTGPAAPIEVVEPPEPPTIDKEADSETSFVGEENGYTITIGNPSDEDVDVNSVTDDLPSGFSYVTGSTTGDVTGEPTDEGGALTWSGDPLVTVPADGSVSFHFDVIVSDTPDEYFNEASAEFANEDTASTGADAPIVVEEPPDIAKTADDSTSQGGEQNGYTITISNPTSDGEGEGEGFVQDTVFYNSITDELPTGFTYVPGSTSGLTEDDPEIDGQTLTWDGFFVIPSESSGELHFNVIVSETPGEYDNEAGAHQTEGDSLSTGPTATITVEEPPSIEKEADSATSEVGTQNGYTIFITNPTEESDTFALDTITYDSITDTLPAGFSYVLGSTTGLTTDDPDVSGQTLTWGGPFNIPSETTESLHFNVTVSGTPGQYLNNASVHEGDSELFTGPTAPVDVTAAPLPPQGPPPALPLPCDPITAEGGPGGDRMVGGIGADRIRSLAGRDIVDTGAGDDEICGGEGGDFLYGRAGSDTIRGEAGNDRLFGGLNPDTLYGDAGHDALIGGKGADSFFTQDGVKDCIMTGKGNDTVTGDVGLDLVDPRGGCPPGF